MKREKISENGKVWLKKETRPYRAFVLFLSCLTAFSTVFSLAFAYVVRYLINSASNGAEKSLWIFATVLLVLLFLRIGLKTIANFCSEQLRAKMTAQLRMNTFSKLLKTEYASLQSYHSGDILQRLTSDIQEVVSVSVGIWPALTGMVVQCVGAIAALMTIDPLFTSVYVVCGCGFGAITAFFRHHIKKRQKEFLEADGVFRSFMQEGYTSVMTLKAYGAEAKTTQKSGGFAKAYYTKRMKRNIVNACMNFIFSLLSNFGLILAVVWCGISVLNGNPDYGSLLSVVLLLMQLQQPFSSFSTILPAYYARNASGERLAELDNLPSETESVEQQKKDDYETLRAIEFCDVDFTYGREQIFTKANVTIPMGKIVCLTGASGAGKSTVFKLLLDVFTVSNGGVYLRGEDEKKERLSAKDRSLFAYVPQGNFLFSGTIYENLTFFCDEEDKNVLDEKIKMALSVACANFVWELPDGLATVLTEGGAGLSEGQRQRLAVARAILSNRPILLLDEATSALDGETEQELLKNVKALENKTCLIVTHRPAALEIADHILHVENEKIIQIK